MNSKVQFDIGGKALHLHYLSLLRSKMGTWFGQRLKLDVQLSVPALWQPGCILLRELRLHQSEQVQQQGVMVIRETPILGYGL